MWVEYKNHVDVRHTSFNFKMSCIYAYLKYFFDDQNLMRYYDKNLIPANGGGTGQKRRLMSV